MKKFFTTEEIKERLDKSGNFTIVYKDKIVRFKKMKIGDEGCNC